MVRAVFLDGFVGTRPVAVLHHADAGGHLGSHVDRGVVRVREASVGDAVNVAGGENFKRLGA